MKNENSGNLLDHHFARAMVRRSSIDIGQQQRLYEILSQLSSVYGSGSSCLRVGVEEQKLLQTSGLVSDTMDAPLVLKGDLLYLQRQFKYESRLAGQLAVMVPQQDESELDDVLLDQLFGVDEKTDLQRQAAVVALKRKLCIISGGPGTGKTTTVVKILSFLQTVHGGKLNIALAAPTGKAAMRLMESISSGLERLDPAMTDSIPYAAVTLHRLLGTVMHSVQFRHNLENPLQYDVVVVDEASMVDLAMMSKLVDALKPDSRLILLGDKDQLVSVESGAVLADLIASLPDNTVTLTKTYRFDDNIKRFAASIITNDSETAWKLLADETRENVQLLSLPLAQLLQQKMEPYCNVLKGDWRLEEVFQIFHRFKPLCAMNSGPYGVANVNRMVELYLSRMGLECQDWYHGRPVMISRNDYSLGLYNGDVGICLQSCEHGGLEVWFPKPDGGFRCYPPYRLPVCTTVFGMTIHKSQGSEFDEVLVILPNEDSQILSRELIYTGVTRARKLVNMYCTKEILSLCISRRVARTSGLVNSLTV